MVRMPRITISTTALATGAAIVALVGLPMAVQADDMATNNEIKAAVSGNTLQGSMLESTYAEFYGADGSIKGKDYTGKWRIADDVMCFKYGDKPENCWGFEINGPAVTLFKDGKVDGVGVLRKGNPHKF